MKRPLVTAGVALATAVGVSLAGWLDPVHAFLLAAVAAVVVLVWHRLDDGVEEPWPDVPEETRPGARHDVSELGWATFTRSGEVSDRVVRRVRALATARLARHGVDAGDPAQAADVERLLGPDVAAGLASRRAPTARVLGRWLDGLERIGPKTTTPPPAAPGPPTGRHPR